MPAVLLLRILLITLPGLLFGFSASSQKHTNAWLRGTTGFEAGGKLRVDLEFQHRRQNGFDNNLMLDKKLMFAFRTWLHYQHGKNVRFSVSPFARFINYKIIQKQGDEGALPVSESRFTAAAEFQHLIRERFFLGVRSAAEYRVLSTAPDNVVRLRNRFGVGIKLHEQLKVGLYDELLVNIAGVPSLHFYDQNRLGLSMDYRVSERLRLEVGYIYLSRLPVNTLDIIDENNVFVNLSWLVNRH